MPGVKESFGEKSLPLEGKVAFAKQMTDEV
jgi:hypothetical protein